LKLPNPEGIEMEMVYVLVFVMAYMAISLEHQLNINKSAPALLGAGVLWTLYAFQLGDSRLLVEHLNDSLITTAQIVFFLMGAMTIVEVVDAHHGFDVITRRIRTQKLSTLMWLVGVVTFFLSAILDNLTTAIVMVSLMKKLLRDREDRLFFAGMIVIAANAGGAWSPLGDVTTTMLWIGGQITALAIMKTLIIPSLLAALIPLAITAWMLRGRAVQAPDADPNDALEKPSDGSFMFWLGLGILIAVPVFKTLTGLPPFMGMLLGLGLLWLISDVMHHSKAHEDQAHLTLVNSLSRIDMGSLTFFMGILLAVAVLEHAHLLGNLAHWLNDTVGRMDVIVLMIGLASAVVDNVPLVAASMAMYNLTDHPPDSFLWEFIAFCAGTGGSVLIIGSAAGVAAMGLEKINFFWYVKRISGLALAGYFAGALAYIIQFNLTH
jgi:Na+/H+ antiporter NhaD/arsenite permease-like protein